MSFEDVAAGHAPCFRRSREILRLRSGDSPILERAVDERQILGFAAVARLVAKHSLDEPGQVGALLDSRRCGCLTIGVLAARLQSAKPLLRAGSIEGFAPEILKGKSPSVRGRPLDAGRKQVCCRAGIAEGSVFFLEQNPNLLTAVAKLSTRRVR